jgi:allantoicase
MTTQGGAAPAFTGLPDLASRRLGGSVVYANDELFAEKENLIKPSAPAFAGEFGHKGKVYDGWETRRRREPGHDQAIVRLGVPGIVHGVVVDTAYFRGNYPPEISVEATAADGYPSPAELADAAWRPIVSRGPVRGDAVNYFEVADRRRWSHVRLSIYPDGGVARFRVHGEVVPDPAFLTGTVDLAAAENGGWLLGCSDDFYASPLNLIMPGRAQVMSDGWENARRRGHGNDYAVFALAAAGRLRQVVIDTSCFVGNAPGWVRLLGADERGADERGPDGRTAGESALGGSGGGESALGGSGGGESAFGGSGGGESAFGGSGGGESAFGRSGGGESAFGKSGSGESAFGKYEIGKSDVGELRAGPSLARLVTADPDPSWFEVLPKTRVQPDTRHLFLVEPRIASHVRLDVYPDGGLARLRVYGELVPEALSALRERRQQTAMITES